MPLHPEDNQKYWPLLLTDDLYLLPGDLTAVQLAHAAAQPDKPVVAETVPEVQKKGVTEAAAAAASTVAPHQPDLLWGSLHRGVLVLVEYPEHTLLDRPDGLFLVEILKAVGYDFKDVATLNICRCKLAADWEHIRNLPWQYAISFGIQHPELAFTQENPQYQKLEHSGKTVLLAEKLSLIRADQARKKKLWNLLRQAFV